MKYDQKSFWNRVLILGLLTLPIAPAEAKLSKAAREAAKDTCKTIVKTQVVDPKALPGKIDPGLLCERLDAVFVPPSAPVPPPTLREITYKNEDQFYDVLRKMLKEQQGRKQEVWVRFDPETAPTLSSLEALGPANGYRESGLMTWISKSTGYGNQFCKATANQSLDVGLAASGFNLLVKLFDQLIAKWQASRFYQPAKGYSIIAVYSADVADNQKLLRMRFVPKAFMKPDCGGLTKEAPPFRIGTAKVIQSR